MKLHGLCAVLCLAASATSAGDDVAKHPITHEDLWLMKRVGMPVLSPDGKLVAVSVAQPAYDDSAKSSDLWLIPADGSAPPRRLTFSNGTESGATWSADSRRLAFSAKRDGQDEAQIYVLDIAGGGEAERVTNVATGASRPIWRPDGQAILFSSMTYPGALTDADNKKRIDEKKARKYSARAYDSFPVRHWDRWLDERRPSLMLSRYSVTRPRRATSCPARRLATTPAMAATWTTTATRSTPRGRRMAAPSSLLRRAAATSPPAPTCSSRSTSCLPAAVSRDGSPATRRAMRSRSSPPTAPPCTRALIRTRSSSTTTIASCASTGESGAPPVSSSFKRSVGSFQVSPDGESIYFIAEDQGHDRLYVVPATGGEVREVRPPRDRHARRPAGRGRRRRGRARRDLGQRRQPAGSHAHRSGKRRTAGAARHSTPNALPRSTGNRSRNSGSNRSADGASTT